MGQLPHAVREPRRRAGEVRVAVDDRPHRQAQVLAALERLLEAKLQAASTISPGSSARTASQVVANEYSPGLLSTLAPPAASTISGSQWPEP
jgi:hypothetical protein